MVRLLLWMTVAVVAIAAAGAPATAAAQNGSGNWDPPRLADGQPDLNGTWNNVGSAHIPLELPDALSSARKGCSPWFDYSSG